MLPCWIHRYGLACLAWLLVACGARAVDEETGDYGGQTGSASVPNPPECVCDSVQGAFILRGVVVEVDATLLTVEVSTLLTNDPNSTVGGPEPGTQIRGYYQLGLPCTMQEPRGARVRVTAGAEVLVHYMPLSTEVAPEPTSGHGTLSTVPWGKVLQLTECSTLGSDALSTLFDFDACVEHFTTAPMLDAACASL